MARIIAMKTSKRLTTPIARIAMGPLIRSFRQPRMYLQRHSLTRVRLCFPSLLLLPSGQWRMRFHARRHDCCLKGLHPEHSYS